MAALDNAQGSADRAGSGVADIGDVGTVEQIAARLAVVRDETDDLFSALDAASASAGDADTWSRQAEATRLASMIGYLGQAIDAARQSAVDVKDAVEKEYQEAVAWGSRSPVGGGQSPSPPQPANRWPGYPRLAAVPLPWSDRMHILYGDESNPTSGGHLHGVNRPNKTEFPPDWDEDKIAREVADVARRPDTATEQFGGAWRVTGVRHGVAIRVYVRPNGTIKTGFPIDGPGVKKNPK